MFEHITGTRAQSRPINKVVQSRGPISLLSLLFLGAVALSTNVAGRASRIVSDAGKTMNSQEPQSFQAEYGGYRVDEQPYSTTEDALKANAFLIGLKAAETYEYADECFNNVFDIADSKAYYINNQTYHADEVEAGNKTNGFEIYLNATQIAAGPVADSLPNCYSFTYSIYTVEQARFQQFNNNIGDFFLAFLFNQMGNALNFQTKFARIEELKEQQQFVQVYQEYGDLVYLIWTFQPLEDASLEMVEGFVERWFEEHEWLADDMPEYQQVMIKSGVSQFARGFHALGESYGKNILAAKNVMDKTIAESQSKPRVSQTLSETNQQYADLVNGLFEGIVDVFPYDSNPVRCRANFTEGYSAFGRMFLEGRAFDFADLEFQSDFVIDVSALLKFPFGVSYSCWWGFSTVMVNTDPEADGVITEEEALEEKIRVNNEILTNLLFNLGYIYSDVAAAQNLLSADTLDWKNLGVYVGDAFIRFFWRRRFTRNFEY